MAARPLAGSLLRAASCSAASLSYFDSKDSTFFSSSFFSSSLGTSFAGALGCVFFSSCFGASVFGSSLGGAFFSSLDSAAGFGSRRWTSYLTGGDAGLAGSFFA
jgi:hypothetical protein